MPYSDADLAQYVKEAISAKVVQRAAQVVCGLNKESAITAFPKSECQIGGLDKQSDLAERFMPDYTPEQLEDIKPYLAISYVKPWADNVEGGIVILPVDTCDPDEVKIALEEFLKTTNFCSSEVYSWPVVVKNGTYRPECVTWPNQK